MKKKSLCDDRSCQSTKSAKYILHFDKNCQDTKGIHMWLVKPAMQSSNTWSVTKQCHMLLPKPAMKQTTYKMFPQDDKNCQSIKKYSFEECPVSPVCDDKNCQSAKPMCYVKSEEAQSSHMWSVPNTACKQIRIQPEVTRNSVHVVLHTHAYFVCQQALCEHPQARAVTHLKLQKCLQFQESTRDNLTIMVLEALRCNLHVRGQWTQGRCNLTIIGQHRLRSKRSHKSTQSYKNKQANKGHWDLSLNFKFYMFILSWIIMDLHSVTVYMQDHPIVMANV